MQEQLVSITADELQLDGVLSLPEGAVGIVLFAQGASAGGDPVHAALHAASYAAAHATSQDFLRAGIATLRFDYGDIDPGGGSNGHAYLVRSDIVLLARQLEKALGWLQLDPSTRHLPCGLYGDGISAAVVIQLAAWRGKQIAALAVCDGQMEMAGKAALENVRVPSLLIVGGRDPDVLGLNRMAFATLHCDKQLEQTVAPGGPDARHQAAVLATDWYTHHFNGHASMES